jgi:hypothetical protein
MEIDWTTGQEQRHVHIKVLWSTGKPTDGSDGQSLEGLLHDA